MTIKEHPIITAACLLLLSCCWENCLGMFDQLASADIILAPTNKLAASTEKDDHSVVFKEEGGSLYTITMQHYQKANETLLSTKSPRSKRGRVFFNTIVYGDHSIFAPQSKFNRIQGRLDRAAHL
jgi:hypothetical protein